MSFCTSIHCIDGRIQEPLIKYLKAEFAVDYVDAITEAGACKILAEHTDKTAVDSILLRTAISLNNHGSRLIAVSGHYDCAGNPVDEATQKDQIEKSLAYLATLYPDTALVGLWIDHQWTVHRL